MAEDKGDSKAWCPSCGDEMFIEQKSLEPYVPWRYYCFGCDKHFIFTEIKVGVKDGGR